MWVGLPDFMKLSASGAIEYIVQRRKFVKCGRVALEIVEKISGEPIPRSGLGIRILGDVNAEKEDTSGEVDYIFIQGLKDQAFYDQVWQAGSDFASHSIRVGVMGDNVLIEKVVALRASDQWME